MVYTILRNLTVLRISNTLNSMYPSEIIHSTPNPTGC
nr:MAG TPA: hypothetical protein [Caudoviricetes sp.]